MIEAVGKTIIVKPIYQEKKSTVILTNAEDNPIAWEIVSIGDQVKGVKKGDNILLAPYSLQQIEYKKEKLFVCQIENIYAKNVM